MKNVSLIQGTQKFNLDLKEGLSPLFSIAKIYVMFAGGQANRTSFPKEVIEANLHTLKNIPIVGEYVEEDKNFKGHGGEIDIEHGKVKFKETTVPIGVVPSNAIFSWETMTDNRGIPREYLVVENAYIWNRDLDMVNALKNDTFGQSMEVFIEDSYYSNDIEIVQSFFFKALCVLGIDKNGSGGVTPAFSNAKIVTYENQRFDDEMSDMLRDFKKAMFEIDNSQSTKEVEEDRNLNLSEMLEKYHLSLETVKEKFPNYEALEVEELEAKIIEMQADEEAEAEVKDDTEVEDEKVEDEVEDEVENDEIEDDESENDEVADIIEDEVKDEVEDEVEDTDDSEADEKDMAELDAELERYEETVKRLTEENESLRAKVSGLEKEVEVFVKAEHESKCMEKIHEFSELHNFSELDIQELESEIHNVESVKELETKMFEKIGRMIQEEKLESGDKSYTRIPARKQPAKSKAYGFESLFIK